jgi:hypothetical protein
MARTIRCVRTLLAMLTLLVGTGLVAGETRTATTAERQACEAPILRQIEQIEARPRSGYDGAEGERFKQRRRALQARRLACRKFPPAT